MGWGKMVGFGTSVITFGYVVFLALILRTIIWRYQFLQTCSSPNPDPLMFIWLHWVLVVACELLVEACGI